MPKQHVSTLIPQYAILSLNKMTIIHRSGLIFTESNQI